MGEYNHTLLERKKPYEKRANKS